MSLLVYGAFSELIFGCTAFISFKTDRHDSALCFGALSLAGAILVGMAL